MTVRVVVADDHAPTRMGVRLSLEEDGFEVVAEAATAAQAVSAVAEHRPDVALLDVHMPGGGIAAARAIAEQASATAVVMLTVSRDDADLFEALRAGARGYLLKDIDPARLPHALQGVLDGEAALPRGLVARLVSEFHRRERVPHTTSASTSTLTAREWEVLRMLGEGMTTGQIAEQMAIAPVTVRSYVSAVLRKLKLDSREAAVRFLHGG